MKTFFFHLMPYADLDLNYVDEHNSAWVTLPNSYFDRQKGHALYNRYLGELELADQLGFDGICVNEHHQTAYGIMPAPNVIAGALARSTKSAKIAVLGRALPLVNNPVNIAEEFAMLDQMSGGRLITGFVRGIGSEYFASSINPTLSHERYYEAHELILKAWTQAGPFRYHGRHFQFEYVNIWPRPFQEPHPPVWVPSQGSMETIVWAASSERRYTYLQTFSPLKNAKKAFDAYRAAAQESGYEADASQIGWAVPIYVAETDEIAREELRPHIENFFNRFLRFPFEMRFPPGYSSIASTKSLIESKVLARANATSLEALMELGMVVCGSAATVRDRLNYLQGELGFGNLIAMLQVATLPAELTDKNLRLFASGVMPYLTGAQQRSPNVSAAE
ncbi:MAG: class flavin-dependent oxidoreductase [Hyphomicrobiales bacterium]|nr:class flavin-dependent oxidoreductase [Hyphomicrobiales bacterium]